MIEMTKAEVDEAVKLAEYVGTNGSGSDHIDQLALAVLYLAAKLAEAQATIIKLKTSSWYDRVRL